MDDEKILQDFAASVVLLLPGPAASLAIEANQRLNSASDNPIKLGDSDRLPHITLAVGCVNETDSPQIDKVLSYLAKTFSGMRLETVPCEGPCGWFLIKKHKHLQELHDAVMTRLVPYFSYSVTGRMLCLDDGELPEEKTLSFIREYALRSSFEDYTPHITIGSGEVDVPYTKTRFLVSKMAFCRLGNYGTVRKVLQTYDLVKGE